MKNKKEKYFRYFSYGSNMLRARLEARVGKVLRVGTGFVNGYELQFNCGTRYSSFANIVRNVNKRIYGVVYLLTAHQIRILDGYEGLYRKQILSVNGLDTLVYISPEDFKEGVTPPTYSYVSLLLRGYKENSLNKAYARLKTKLINLYGDRII